MNHLDVRRAGPKDIPAAAQLAGELVRDHHTADRARFFMPERVVDGYAEWLAREAAREGAVVVVAVMDAIVEGYAYGTLEGRDWNRLLDEHGALHDVFVVERARGQGAGKRLLLAVIRELEAKGAKRIVLSTRVDNHRAQGMFKGLGFRPTMLEMTRGRT